ncbi:hypothetical protein OsJ_26184 [Oryza sativa Japonica Group]|uniref:Uncharacterized protein n=1 Tax=Oryza sativa subsp. japonica TaxID=39947 RepID=A3BQ11_ORYSJ|nr:hypothetical protein OsJ_26184 [Oryza sativa Japonica Group]
MARPHAVVVPYPGSGNINPALQLAKLLHGHGIYITFVNTEHNHRRALAAEGAAAVRGRDGFQFETIPDGLLDADRDAADYDLGLSVATSHRCAAPLRDLVARAERRRRRISGRRRRRSAGDVHGAHGADELRAGRGAGAGLADDGAVGRQRGVADGAHEDPGAPGERLHPPQR